MPGTPSPENPSAASLAGGATASGPPSNFLVTPEGNLVVAAPNEREWDRLATIKSLADTIANAIPAESIPDELKCRQCGGLLKSAVRMPCCGALFCDECLRRLFEEALGDVATAAASPPASLACPQCGTRQSPEQALPDQEIRAKVAIFIESHNKFVIPEGAVAAAAGVPADERPGDEDAGAREQREDGETSPEKQSTSGAMRTPYPPIPFPFVIPGFMPPLPPGMALPFPGFPFPPPPVPSRQRHPPDIKDQKARSRSPSPPSARARRRSRSRSPS